MIKILGKVPSLQFRKMAAQPRVTAAAALLPGVFFVLLGVLALVAPSFLVALAAAFFIYLGCIMLFLGWKFVQLKRKMSEVAKRFEAHIEVHGFGSSRPYEEPREEFSKKTIVH